MEIERPLLLGPDRTRRFFYSNLKDPLTHVGVSEPAEDREEQKDRPVCE